MATKATKDFSAPAGGRRLRISLDVYNPANRQFRHVKGVGARITVRNKAEETRLWRAIEKAIAGNDWRSGDDSASDPDAAGPGAGGEARS